MVVKGVDVGNQSGGGPPGTPHQRRHNFCLRLYVRGKDYDRFRTSKPQGSNGIMALHHVAERAICWPVPATCGAFPAFVRSSALSHQLRRYATQSTSSRKQITIASDDGRLRWNELSAREKAARTTQQSFNLLVVVGGILMTVSAAFFHTKTRHNGA